MKTSRKSYIELSTNHWIDLIFGKDQKSFEKCNVFYPLSYVENIKPEEIELNKLEATMNQISFFGQNPYMLFSKEHPKKKLKVASLNFMNSSLDLTPQEAREGKKGDI